MGSNAIIQFTSLVCLLLGGANASESVHIEVAGELFVDLDAADETAAEDTWNNAGTIGDFERIGDPRVRRIAGITAVEFNWGESKDAWRCLDVVPESLVGLSPTRSVEVWAFNPAIAAEEPLVAIARRGGPFGSCFNFNYGSAGHGAVTHWGTSDIGWGELPAAGRWHHLAMTFDGQMIRVFVDGRETNREPVGRNGIRSHGGSRIVIGTGIRPDNEPEFGDLRSTLAIAKVRIHDGVLTPDQVFHNFYLESASLGLIENPGELRFIKTPASEAFRETKNGLEYSALIDVRGLPLPKLTMVSPVKAVIERLTPERHRLTYQVPHQQQGTINFAIVANNGKHSANAAWQVRLRPLHFSTQLLALDTNECCDIADVNRDGRLDVIAGRSWFAAPEFVPRPLRSISEFGRDYTANNGDHALDVNGDGWVDVVAGSFNETQIHWYQNPGKEGLIFGKQWQAHLLVDTEVKDNEMTSLYDIDGDGRPELWVNSWNVANPMLAWKLVSRGQDEVGLAKIEISPRGNGHGQGFGDVNGDGLTDVLFLNGWYEQPANDALDSHWKLHPDWHLSEASCPILIRDVNADGYNDVVYGNGHGYGLYWMEQGTPGDDGTTYWKKHVIDSSFSQAHVLHWVDLDDDGQDELITGKRVRAHSGSDPGARENAEVYFYRWDRDRQIFTRYTIASNGVGTGLQIRAGDMNQDGRTDLVVAGKSGTYLLVNQGVRVPEELTDETIVEQGPIELRDGDRVVFLGNSLIERAQRFGFIETALTSRFPDSRIEFRNIGWSGDTVFGDSRAPGRTGAVFGTAAQGFENLVQQVRDTAPTLIVVGYGFNESFAGKEGIEDFRVGLRRLLTALTGITPRVLVLSTTPQFETSGDAESALIRNRQLSTYSNSLALEAVDLQASFVDIFTALDESNSKLATKFGIHLTELGYQQIATTIESALAPGAKSWNLVIQDNEVLRADAVRVTDFFTDPTVTRMTVVDHHLPVGGEARTLQLVGVPRGNYVVQINGVEVAAGDHSQLDTGIKWMQGAPYEQARTLRQTIIHKNRLFFHSWRPRNTAFISGERKDEQSPSHGDVPDFVPLVVEQEAIVAKLKRPRPYTIEIKQKQ